MAHLFQSASSLSTTENYQITAPQMVAFLAPLINTVEMLPQLYKTYYMKEVKDLSLMTIIFMLTANLLWLLHGYYIGDFAVGVSALFSTIVNGSLLFLYMSYAKHRSVT